MLARLRERLEPTKVDWVLAPHPPLHEENGLARMRSEMADDPPC